MSLAGHILKQVPFKEVTMEDVSTDLFKDSLRVSLSLSVSLSSFMACEHVQSTPPL